MILIGVLTGAAMVGLPNHALLEHPMEDFKKVSSVEPGQRLRWGTD